MICSKCGYMMDAFALACPRCALKKKDDEIEQRYAREQVARREAIESQKQLERDKYRRPSTTVQRQKGEMRNHPSVDIEITLEQLNETQADTTSKATNRATSSGMSDNNSRTNASYAQSSKQLLTSTLPQQSKIDLANPENIKLSGEEAEQFTRALAQQAVEHMDAGVTTLREFRRKLSEEFGQHFRNEKVFWHIVRAWNMAKANPDAFRVAPAVIEIVITSDQLMESRPSTVSNTNETYDNIHRMGAPTTDLYGRPLSPAGTAGVGAAVPLVPNDSIIGKNCPGTQAFSSYIPYAYDSFIGKNCPYCQSPIKPGASIIICEICAMPHHIDCWRENGHCTTFGCNGNDRSSQADDSHDNESGHEQPGHEAWRLAAQRAVSNSQNNHSQDQQTIKPFSELTDKQIMIECLRWVAILPAAVLGFILIGAISRLFNSEDMGRVVATIMSAITEGAAFVYIGAEVAPRYQRYTALVMCVFMIVFCVFACIFYSQRDAGILIYIWIVLDAGGAIAAAIGIWKNKK